MPMTAGLVQRAPTFITHHDEVILISIRGTLELADWWRDVDAGTSAF